LKVGEEIRLWVPGDAEKVVPAWRCSSALYEALAGDKWAAAAGTERRRGRGQVVAKPGSITPHTKFKAERLLTRKAGGTPRSSPYRPQFISAPGRDRRT